MHIWTRQSAAIRRSQRGVVLTQYNPLCDRRIAALSRAQICIYFLRLVLFREFKGAHKRVVTRFVVVLHFAFHRHEIEAVFHHQCAPFKVDTACTDEEIKRLVSIDEREIRKDQLVIRIVR